MIMYPPTALKRHRFVKSTGRTYDPSKLDKDQFVLAASHLIPEVRLSKPLRCYIKFYCKRPQSHYRTGRFKDQLRQDAPKYNTNAKDIDNMIKFVFDAFNEVMYVDDNQIVEIHCEKLYSEGEPYHYFKVEELSDNEGEMIES